MFGCGSCGVDLLGRCRFTQFAPSSSDYEGLFSARFPFSLVGSLLTSAYSASEHSSADSLPLLTMSLSVLRLRSLPRIDHPGVHEGLGSLFVLVWSVGCGLAVCWLEGSRFAVLLIRRGRGLLIGWDRCFIVSFRLLSLLGLVLFWLVFTFAYDKRVVLTLIMDCLP